MKQLPLLIFGIVVIGAGAGGYVYMTKKKKEKAAKEELERLATIESERLLMEQKKASIATFCNPPLTGTGIDKAQSKFNYQYAYAVREWENQGRGMDPYFFYEQYLQSNCPL